MSETPTRILLLEDDPAHAELISRSFQAAATGAVLTPVRKIADAHTAIQTQSFDLLLADWRLPDGSGLDLIDEAGSKGLPVVIMTGFGDENRAVAAMKAGALEYVVKSELAFEELPRTVDRVIREWGHITQRRRAEKALRDSEEYFRALIENAHDVITEIGPDAVVHYVSPSGVRLLGASTEEQVGREILEAIHPEDRENASDRIAMAFETPGSPVAIRARVGHRSGIWKHVEASCTAHRAQGGSLRGVLNIRDVTDRVTAEEEREQLETELRRTQRLESIGQLAGGIAHDFNNLLTIIGGHAEILGWDAENGVVEDLADRVAEIRAAQEAGAALTRQLLTFGRKQVIQPVVLDLNEMVLEVKGMMARVLREDIRFLTHLAGEEIQAKLDPGQIQQIILNLLVNSQDALPDGGSVTVSTRKEVLLEPPVIGGGLLPAGPYVVLTVQDDGIGMDTEVQRKIFDPFFTTKPRGRGTGLGLATVFGIVRQAKGGIFVESHPGEGTRFDVFLPAAGAEQGPAPLARRSGAMPGGQETILVTEDDPGLLNLVVRVLKGLGYTVMKAATVREARALIGSHSREIHLLLTDLVLPDGNGRGLGEFARKANPEVRVVFMSGYADNVLGDDLVLDSSIPFLSKPFTTVSLSQTVRDALDDAPAVPSPTEPHDSVPGS